jgi:phosphoglycolate phosphatase-like HAD superfamily hydrolase
VALDAVEALAPAQTDTEDPVLVFGWTPGTTVDAKTELQARFGTRMLCCSHAPGAARCWCRPPLPGLVLALARRHGVDVSASVIVGTSEAHARMARALGASYRPAR